jgi:hypothetical protein
MSTGIRVSDMDTTFSYPFYKYPLISNVIHTHTRGYRLVPKSVPNEFFTHSTQIIDIYCHLYNPGKGLGGVSGWKHDGAQFGPSHASTLFGPPWIEVIAFIQKSIEVTDFIQKGIDVIAYDRQAVYSTT